ncbi:MAG: hypothetical protein CK425_11195 [Parachlamydia sp.]|nr:MAG: hypothetical protein CK425_11195 [Parachlamydia sp.]
MNRPYVILMLCLSTSCQSYRTVFDCPPGEGVPCTSVTQIEKMIIESDEGPDIFVREKMSPYCAKKIWVNENPDECGSKGYYIYIPD